MPRAPLLLTRATEHATAQPMVWNARPPARAHSLGREGPTDLVPWGGRSRDDAAREARPAPSAPVFVKGSLRCSGFM